MRYNTQNQGKANTKKNTKNSKYVKNTSDPR